MDKLIEISIRGSMYYFLNSLSQNQIENLQKYTPKFYTSHPALSGESDETILKVFVSEIHKEFGIVLTVIPIATVLVIK